MMLHNTERNLIAGTDLAQSKACCDKVNGLGSRSREDDLLSRPCIQEPPHCLARGFIGFRRRICQKVQSAMDIRVFMLICMNQPVDDNLRLLRGRRIVEVNERFAIGSFAEDRKILAELSQRRMRPDSLELRRSRSGLHRSGIALAANSSYALPREPSAKRPSQRFGQKVVFNTADRFFSKRLQQH